MYIINFDKIFASANKMIPVGFHSSLVVDAAARLVAHYQGNSPEDYLERRPAHGSSQLALDARVLDQYFDLLMENGADASTQVWIQKNASSVEDFARWILAGDHMAHIWMDQMDRIERIANP